MNLNEIGDIIYSEYYNPLTLETWCYFTCLNKENKKWTQIKIKKEELIEFLLKEKSNGN